MKRFLSPLNLLVLFLLVLVLLLTEEKWFFAFEAFLLGGALGVNLGNDLARKATDAVGELAEEAYNLGFQNGVRAARREARLGEGVKVKPGRGVKA